MIVRPALLQDERAQRQSLAMMPGQLNQALVLERLAVGFAFREEPNRVRAHLDLVGMAQFCAALLNGAVEQGRHHVLVDFEPPGALRVAFDVGLMFPQFRVGQVNVAVGMRTDAHGPAVGAKRVSQLMLLKNHQTHGGSPKAERWPRFYQT